ncbi:MAG: TIGR01212 family radical SAM protein [Wujia sp.]
MDSQIDWLDKPYYSLNAYFKARYGEKCYKIAVDAGCTCPNRDGTIDNRGCIFCSAGGSGDFAVDIRGSLPFEHRAGIRFSGVKDGVYYKMYSDRGNDRRRSVDVARQIERGMAMFNKRVGERFVIYFQAYTNTYGDLSYLRAIWDEALANDNVVGISIATRPDCLGEEVITALRELKEKYSGEANPKFIWIELGLQTIHESTSAYIRRGYDLTCYEAAVTVLKEADIPFITHIILGLPGEDAGMMLETINYVCCSIRRPFGIKLQLLHVLEGTDLAKDYERGSFEVLSQEEYIDLVIELIRYIPKEVVLHRVTGDGPKKILIAPKWSGNKKQVLNSLHKRFRELQACQGDKYIEK